MTPWGPDWLADSDDSDSPFRDGWDMYSLTKAFPNLRAGVFDIAAMLHKSRFGDLRGSLQRGDTFQNSNASSANIFNMSNRSVRREMA